MDEPWKSKETIKGGEKPLGFNIIHEVKDICLVFVGLSIGYFTSKYCYQAHYGAIFLWFYIMPISFLIISIIASLKRLYYLSLLPIFWFYIFTKLEIYSNNNVSNYKSINDILIFFFQVIIALLIIIPIHLIRKQK